MARGRSTSARTQAREAARRRKTAADAERRHRDTVEVEAATEFEIARRERDAADQRAADQVRRLDELGTHTDRTAMLLDETPGEIKRLRKLPTSDSTANEAAEPAAAHPPSGPADGQLSPASESWAAG